MAPEGFQTQTSIDIHAQENPTYLWSWSCGSSMKLLSRNLEQQEVRLDYYCESGQGEPERMQLAASVKLPDGSWMDGWTWGEKGSTWLGRARSEVGDPIRRQTLRGRRGRTRGPARTEPRLLTAVRSSYCSLARRLRPRFALPGSINAAA